MKKLDIGQTLGILANVGVIAGIVFLGFELRQNNSFLAAQARSQLTANRISANEMELVPENLSVINKAQNGEELTQEETLRLRFIGTGIFVRWEAEYKEQPLECTLRPTFLLRGIVSHFRVFQAFGTGGKLGNAQRIQVSSSSWRRTSLMSVNQCLLLAAVSCHKSFSAV